MLKWIIGLVICSPLIFGAALLVASEYGGEKVELETLDDRGTSFFTTLWVVELHDEPWLRAVDPEATWLQRLRADPQVFLIRDGERREFQAEISDGDAWRVTEAVREKYAWADQVVSLIHDPEAVVAVRLVERSAFDE